MNLSPTSSWSTHFSVETTIIHCLVTIIVETCLTLFPLPPWFCLECDIHRSTNLNYALRSDRGTQTAINNVWTQLSRVLLKGLLSIVSANQPWFIHTSLSGKFAETQRSCSLIPVENPLKSSLTVAYDHRDIQWWHAGLCGIAMSVCGQTGEAQALQAKCRCHQFVSEKKSDGERECDRLAN